MSCCDPNAVTEEIAYGWVCEVHNHCTCGAGGEFGHEPACGLVPLHRASGEDDEQFCPACRAGTTSSEHLTKPCGEDDR